MKYNCVRAIVACVAEAAMPSSRWLTLTALCEKVEPLPLAKL